MHNHKAFPDEVPEGLRPRLRVFFSADLVGSTSFKQSRMTWHPEILSFYRNFDYILHKKYQDFAASLEGALPPPEFWKSNGDELIYTWELQNLTHAHAVMHIWLATLEEYRDTDTDLPTHLDVKSTAWIALFPTPNAESFFRRGSAAPKKGGGLNDAILLQSEMRDDWYTNGHSFEFTKEYVGPSIDTGFRLTAWAAPNRLVISVDLAFLLTASPASSLERLKLHLSGKEKLKGVIDDEPYPMIWIPVGEHRPNNMEDWREAQISRDAGVIRSQCEAIIEKHYRFITPIFLSVATQEEYEWVPPFILNEILEHWREEDLYKRLLLDERQPQTAPAE